MKTFSICAIHPWRSLISTIHQSANQPVNQPVNQPPTQQIGKSLISLVLTLGLTAVSSTSLLTQRSIAIPIKGSVQANVPSADLIAAQANPAQPLTDGVYLYGQSPDRDRLGSAYMVFEVNDGQVIGAFYMPRSSFDCFKGNFADNQLALTIRESYSQEEYPYTVALEATDSVASANGEVTPVSLAGYHAIANVNRRDRQILSTCKVDMD